MAIKDIIKASRKKSGLSQAKYGETIGVSGATVSRWESRDLAGSFYSASQAWLK